jgi:hypothetical protein
MQKLSNQKYDYDEVDSLYKDLIHDLESKGYNILNGSDSKTDFGHSKYFYVNYQNKSSENYGNGLKVRVSDHTVMNRDRMLNEIHFRTKDLNNYMNDRSMFIIDKYFKPELFKKITEKENYTEELRVGGNEYNPETDTIIENLGKSKRGNDSYKVLRKKYRLVDYYIDSRDNKKYKYSKGGNVYVAFESNQIKLADGTNTTFDANNSDIRFDGGGEVEDLISKGIVELKMFDTKPEHAKQYGLDSINPLYVQTLSVTKNKRLQGIGNKVLQYINDYAIKNGHDVVFGHITQKAEPNIDILKSMLIKSGFNTCEGNNDFYKKIDIRYKEGGRTISQTPAPKKEQIYGSEKNKAGSSKDIKSAKSIKFSESTVEKLINKIDQHNENYPNKKIDLATAKSVVRRGMGAYSSSHRPTISGGRPNSRVAWGIARLNAFIYKIINGKSKSGKYNQDDDLIKELGYKVKNYAGGGELNEEATMYVDIISNNPTSPSVEKYKKLLLDKYNIDFDKNYKEKDLFYLANLDLNNIQNKDEFLSFDNYLDYGKKISEKRGFIKMDDYATPYDINPTDVLTRLSNELGFDIEKKDYSDGQGGIAHAFGGKLWYTDYVDMYYVLHELGHIYDFIHQYEGLAKKPTHAPTEYGTSNVGEVFAENFAIYFINPEALKNWNKIVYEELDLSINNKWKDALNRELSKARDFKNGGEIDFPINNYIYYDNFTESLDAKLYQQATKYFSKKVTDDYWHFSVQYFNGEQITYEVYSEKGGFWLNFKIKNKNLVISSAKMYSIQKYKEGGEVDTQYQKRNIGGSDVYYKKENNGKWSFISKEEFDLNANNNNTILFNSNSEMDSKDTITMDVPLFIRMLEMAREDIKSDEQLHQVVENVLDLKDRTQTMDDYEYLAEPLQENYALGGILNNRPYARMIYVIWNNFVGNMELGTYNTEFIGSNVRSIIQGGFQTMSDVYTEFFDYIKSEDGLYFSRKHPKSIWKIESRFYDGVSEDSDGYPMAKEKVLFKMSAKELIDMYDANVLKRGGQTVTLSNNRHEEGGVIEGQLHSECNDDDGCGEKFEVGKGGHMIEAERDEAVIVSKAFDDNKKYTIEGEPSEIASALNVLGGGKNFDSGATIVTDKGEKIKTEEIKPEAKDKDVERTLESGSIIINRRSMADKKDYKVTGTPRQIASAINSINGNGVVIEDGAIIK